MTTLFICKAIEDANKAIELDPNDSLYEGTKTEILFKMGKEEEFFASLERALQLGIDPNILDREIKKKYGETERYTKLLGKYPNE